MAFAGALLAIGLYLLGFHSDPEKFGTAQWVGTLGGLTIGVVCITLGIKARRAAAPVTEDFGYGRALGTGVLIALFSSLFGIATSLLYSTLINPGFVDVIVQAQVAKLEEKGLSAAQIEGAEKMIRTMSSPGIQSVFSFFGGLLFGTLISLVTAAFLKRPAAAAPLEPPITAG